MAAATYPSFQAMEEIQDGPDFSLVRGGPLYQLLRRTRLANEALGLAPRRVVVAIAVMWAPLMVLAALQGGLLGDTHGVPLIEDIGSQLRFLVVAPLLILAEVVVHRRMQPIVAQFRLRELIRPDQAGRFEAALEQAARWRNSIVAEVLLLGTAYAVGVLFTFGRYVAMRTGGWYARPEGGLSLAGLWLVFVSLPLLQFLILRWYFRLAIWARLLWRVSRLDLDLDATHPDKAGGLGFLGDSLAAFVPVSGAHGVLVAGMICNRIFFGHAQLAQFEVEIVGGAGILLAVFAGPLLLLSPRLARVKRMGLRAYGGLGQVYVRTFRAKWLSGTPADEPLIGSGDIQSLADLGNSFTAAEQMRIVPLHLANVATFLAAFLAPIAPLLLTMMSADKLIGRLVSVVF